MTDGPTGEIMMEACRNALPGIEAGQLFPSPVYSSAISFRFFCFECGHFRTGKEAESYIESSKHETGLPVFLSVFLSFFNHTVLVVLCQVRKALDSEFGQAVAVANLVRPQ